MEIHVEKIFNQLFKEYPLLEGCTDSILEAFELLRSCYTSGGKVLICGNGGSASDSEHIVGELMKGFLVKRGICGEHVKKLKSFYPDDWEYLAANLQGALPAISLVSQSAIFTAFVNDVAADMVFAQQVYGYAKEGDILIGLSTSGNSGNVVNALKIAKMMGMKTIGFTGVRGGVLSSICDTCVKAPANETYKIQEYHLPIYHALCAMTEAEFFE